MLGLPPLSSPKAKQTERHLVVVSTSPDRPELDLPPVKTLRDEDRKLAPVSSHGCRFSAGPCSTPACPGKYISQLLPRKARSLKLGLVVGAAGPGPKEHEGVPKDSKEMTHGGWQGSGGAGPGPALQPAADAGPALPPSRAKQAGRPRRPERPALVGPGGEDASASLLRPQPGTRKVARAEEAGGEEGRREAEAWTRRAAASARRGANGDEKQMSLQDQLFSPRRPPPPELR
ncbi:putative uncharacterized protein SERTAD4-AS1, partial [Plecturocebus cupreus]